MDSDPVYVKKCDSYSEKNIYADVKELLEGSGGMDNFIRPGQKVVLKVNMLSGVNPERAVTTDPRFVSAVAELVKEAGGSPVIADSPGGAFNKKTLEKSYQKCGFKKVAKKTDAELNYNIEHRRVSFPAGEVKKFFNLANFAVDADVIINLPKLKTHGLTVYTGAVKNLFGVLPGLLKAEYHLKMQNIHTFTQMLVDLACLVSPDLNIMDAVVGMEGEGPSSGDVRKFGYLMASESSFNLDIAAVHLLGIDPPEKVPLISVMKEQGITGNFSDLKIYGDKLIQAENTVIPEIERSSNLLEQSLPGPLSSLLEFFLRPRPIFEYDKCTGCGECFQVCPPDAIIMKKGRPVVELEECIRCFCCQELCNFNAVKIHRPFLGRLINKFNGERMEEGVND